MSELLIKTARRISSLMDTAQANKQDSLVWELQKMRWVSVESLNALLAELRESYDGESELELLSVLEAKLLEAMKK